jgi:DNA repair protein RadA/Sms
MKNKTLFRCEKCGADFPKWAGQCTACGGWNCLTETAAEISSGKSAAAGRVLNLQKISETKFSNEKRVSSGFAEFDRVLGGGFFANSISLLAGSPGVGKSTLALQAAIKIAAQKKVLIFSAEESLNQIANRASRISPKNLPENLRIANDFSVENILATAADFRPDFLIVDSVQTFASGEIPSAAGSLPQIRAVCEKLLHFAKTKNCPVILIGHITKSGDFAGPQFLAHLVDAVFYFETEAAHGLRFLRSEKNRFGPAGEIGIFQMESGGLREIADPSEIFLADRLPDAIGSCVFPAVEGGRVFLVELQTLTATTRFGLPKRTASGIPLSRLQILLAVLQNHGKINFENRDAFANAVGGLKIAQPAADLPLILSLISSAKKKPLGEKTFAFGEVGLAGEIRAVIEFEKRIFQAEKLGFEKCFCPPMKKFPKSKIKFIPVRTVGELLGKI